METLKVVEQFEQDLSFLSKPEIIELAARKNLAPKPKSYAQAANTPPTASKDTKTRQPFKGSSLVKGIRANTLVLTHDEGDDLDLDAIKSTVQKNTTLEISRVAMAKSGALVGISQ